MTQVAIIGGKRTPFTKIGTLQRSASTVDLGVGPVNALAKEFDLTQKKDGLCTFGTVIQHPDVSNLAREVALESNLHPEIPAFSTILACATSLSAISEASNWIHSGRVKWAVAGGAESMSNFPVSFPKQMGKTLGDIQFSKTFFQKLAAVLKLRPKHLLPTIPPIAERLTGLTMGQHCELMVKEWKIPREEQDQWAVDTQNKAEAERSWHEKFLTPANHNEKAPLKDNLIRKSAIEKVAKLRPAFSEDGTITAANASPLTDGGSAVLLADLEYAKSQGWPVLAIIDDFELAAVDIRNEGLLMAPPYALLRLLNRQQRKLSDFDLLEIHEAFAAQVLCNLKGLQDPEWCKKRVGLSPTEIPSRDRINPKGGSIPLGHPFGATGARLVMQLATEMSESNLNSGIISICAAGGLGLVATLKKA